MNIILNIILLKIVFSNFSTFCMHPAWNLTDDWGIASILSDSEEKLISKREQAKILKLIEEGDTTKIEIWLANQTSIKKFMEEHQFSCLNFAAQRGHKDILKLLYHYGENINDETNFKLLRTTIKKGHIACSSFLLTQRRDTTWWPNLLQYVVDPQHLKLLLDFAKDHNYDMPLLINTFTGAGPSTNALQYTATQHSALLEQILRYKPDIDMQNDYGETALMLACEARRKKNIRLLLKSGASPNIQSNAGTTPLMFTVKKGAEQCTQLLLDAGASPTIKNDEGHTPLTLALQQKSIALYAQLKWHPIKRDYYKYITALSLVGRKDNEGPTLPKDIVNLIVNYAIRKKIKTTRNYLKKIKLELKKQK